MTGAVAADPCRLALALAIDVSSSVDAREDALQRGGIASALIAPRVMDAFFVSDMPVALAVYEWSGRYNQAVLLDWTVINGPADVTRAAEIIANSRRSHADYPTALGSALGFGAGLLGRAPRCDAQVIDMAGDGVNNEGFGPAEAYAHFPLDGVTVNGLVVMSGEDDATLEQYYRQEVLRGPGAFLEAASGFMDYENAMQRKLLRELQVQMLGGWDRHSPQSQTEPAG